MLSLHNRGETKISWIFLVEIRRGGFSSVPLVERFKEEIKTQGISALKFT